MGSISRFLSKHKYCEKSSQKSERKCLVTPNLVWVTENKYFFYLPVRLTPDRDKSLPLVNSFNRRNIRNDYRLNPWYNVNYIIVQCDGSDNGPPSVRRKVILHFRIRDAHSNANDILRFHIASIAFESESSYLQTIIHIE